MTRRSALALTVLGGCLALGVAPCPGQDSTQKLTLLNVGKGQLPPDTGMDDKTHPEIVDDVKELGGKALKVAFAPGDSIGARAGANANWKRFAFFRFDAVNPAPGPVALELTVVHARSGSYQTRVSVPIKLKPGKNEVKIAPDEMTNVNGFGPGPGPRRALVHSRRRPQRPDGLFRRRLAGGGATSTCPASRRRCGRSSRG